MLDEYERELVREIVLEAKALVKAHLRSLADGDGKAYKAEALRAYERIGVIARTLRREQPDEAADPGGGGD